ncbi:hypothetical protein ACAD15_004465 [Enterobacter bugandensis]|uniref:hypothetical protein n=1 Tax=Enterobacter asburiae TaxID=61645 RepID=UPI0018C333FE|nr:hypothetical protein [Enterobacter asburiae]MBF9773469.1 hypothetical protein [Enterobacter asburiae]
MKSELKHIIVLLSSIIASGSVFASDTPLATQTVEMNVALSDPSSLTMQWTPSPTPLSTDVTTQQEVGVLSVHAKGASYITLADTKPTQKGVFTFRNGNQSFLVSAFQNGDGLLPNDDGKIHAAVTSDSATVTFKASGGLAKLNAGKYTDTVIVESFAS